MNVELFVLSVILTAVLPAIIISSSTSFHFLITFFSIYIPTILYVILKYVYNPSLRSVRIRWRKDRDPTYGNLDFFFLFFLVMVQILFLIFFFLKKNKSSDKNEKSYSEPVEFLQERL